MRLPLRRLVAAVILLVAAGPAAASRTPAGLHPDRALELLARQIGQMIVIGFPGSDPDGRWPTEVAAMIRDGRIGGVVLYAGNIRNPDQLDRLTRVLAGGGGLPPFVAVDQEGGYIQRLTRRKGFRGLRSAGALSGEPLSAVCAAYGAAAEELAAEGINVNLAPVVDLDSGRGSPAIGRLRRSYGGDPDTVAAYAAVFAAAHRRAGILTVAKHFPGHGSAALDPHEAVVDITETWEEHEIEPFARLIDDEAIDMVMVGHLIHPRFSDGDRPASLSRRAIAGALRERLGFDGLVVTDDLQMGAITARYDVEEAAVMAVAAGADLLILANHESADVPVAGRVLAAIEAAVAAGRIPLATIEAAYGRILRAKARLAEPPVRRGSADCHTEAKAE